MSVRVHQLTPGDVVAAGPFTRGCFVAQTPHPIWPDLQLVVWRMADGNWSHDALDARQDVGAAEPTTPDLRARRLRAALVGQDDWTAVQA